MHVAFVSQLSVSVLHSLDIGTGDTIASQPASQAQVKIAGVLSASGVGIAIVGPKHHSFSSVQVTPLPV